MRPSKAALVPFSTPRFPPLKTPVPPRDAATVAVLRDGARGLELYLVKRSRTVDFMAGAHVFPGGRLDKADRSPSTCALLSTEASALHERLGEPLPGDPRHAMPDVLGGRIFRIQLLEGRYRAVKAA